MLQDVDEFRQLIHVSQLHKAWSQQVIQQLTQGLKQWPQGLSQGGGQGGWKDTQGQKGVGDGQYVRGCVCHLTKQVAHVRGTEWLAASQGIGCIEECSGEFIHNAR